LALYKSFTYLLTYLLRLGEQLDLCLKPTKLLYSKDRAKTFIIFGAQPFQEFNIVGPSEF